MKGLGVWLGHQYQKMKLSCGVMSVLLFSGVAVALPSAGENPASNEEEKGLMACPDLRETTPLYRASQNRLKDHFYTIDYNELQYMVSQRGYVNDGYAGRLYSTHERYTTPLYRLFNPWTHDHFYTTSDYERDEYNTSRGYSYERVEGYILPSPICNGIPLYRLWSARATDHFYTTDPRERFEAATYQGYVYEGIAGYVQENDELRRLDSPKLSFSL